MKKLLSLALAFFCLASLLSGCGKKSWVQIDIRGYGSVIVELDSGAAPKTVKNFLKLVNEGFYDGKTFHRIIQGFMMQGGAASPSGAGGSDETVKGEFSANGVKNSLSHTRGAISMARAADYDGASSQFFIVQQDAPALDGQYACFGYVVEGMDVVDAICDSVPVTNSNGAVAEENQPVIESIREIDYKK